MNPNLGCVKKAAGSLLVICLISLCSGASLLSLAGANTTSKDTPAIGKAYYVDSDNGNDTNNGMSEESAWQSLSVVEKAKLLPGDAVKFKRGSKFSRRL